VTFRLGENDEREREWKREIENGRERTRREGKRNLLRGSHAILCSEKAHDLLLDARDWSVKKGVDRSI
jgi:hypothetical protein